MQEQVNYIGISIKPIYRCDREHGNVESDASSIRQKKKNCRKLSLCSISIYLYRNYRSLCDDRLNDLGNKYHLVIELPPNAQLLR